jgi:cell wall-associated NlpC family hydrolase
MSIAIPNIVTPPQVTQLQSYFDQMQTLASNASSEVINSGSSSTNQSLSASGSVTNPFEILLSGQAQQSSSPLSSSTSSSPLSSSAYLGQTGAGNVLPATLQTAISSGATPSGVSIVQAATNELGVPYVWGGSTPSTGFDCSGLVQYAFSTLGVSLPRTAAAQEQVGTPVANLASAQPGDLLFFEPGQNGAPPGEAGHVAIYIGNGQMIAAPETGQDVQVQPVPSTPLAIRRIQVPSFQQLPALGSNLQSVAGVSSGSLQSLSVSNPGTTGPQSPTEMLANVPVPLQYANTITSAASSSGVPAPLLAAILYNESRFNPNVVSSAGAEGIAQFMPATAAANNVNPWDPTSAIQGAAQLLAGYHNAFGNWSDAIAAYAAGGAAVQQAGGIPQDGSTPQYVQSVLSLAQMEAGS